MKASLKYGSLQSVHHPALCNIPWSIVFYCRSYVFNQCETKPTV